MPVFLAISYDTEQAIDCNLPSHIISPSDYAALKKEDKKKIWADYLRQDIWQDPQLAERSQRELQTIRELGDLFAEFNGKFTSFVLGRWLDYVVDAFGQETVRSYFGKETTSGERVIEIGSHSYNHLSYKSTGDKTRDRMAPTLEQDAIYHEIRKANESLQRHLNQVPLGLRTPMGNIAPFHNDNDPEILEAITGNGLQYVSSWLKAQQKVPNQPGDAPPFFYESTPGLLEIPTVGYFDVHHTQPTALLVFDDEHSWTEEERIEYQIGQLIEALYIADTGEGCDVYVPWVFHPWDVKHYDPNLRVHRSILKFATQEKFAREVGVKIVSYAEINQKLRREKGLV